MSKIIMVVNEDRFFLSHRKDIALHACEDGHDVVIAAKDTGRMDEIRRLGFKTMDLPINPTGMNPVQEFETLKKLIKIYRNERPDIVHHVGLKNILWGGIAANLLHVPGVVNAVSGLGGLFNGKKLSLINKSILQVMRLCNLRKGVKVIFQNNDDMSIFLSQNVVKPSQIAFTKGSGIDLEDFAYTLPPVEGKIRIIFTARMVKEKGVCDLIEAAEKLRPKYSDKIEFLLCGRLTSNANGVNKEYLETHCDGKFIQWLGERNDIKELLVSSHIMAFPSYYREGVPKSLIEASAIGRPIVTCNSVGCRDVVDDGENGFLVEPQNPSMLAMKLETLIIDRNLRKKMGIKAREKAEREFSIQRVVSTHLEIYKELL